jgi:hypothetical protein
MELAQAESSVTGRIFWCPIADARHRRLRGPAPGIDRMGQLPAVKRLRRIRQHPRSLAARTMWPPILLPGIPQ